MRWHSVVPVAQRAWHQADSAHACKSAACLHAHNQDAHVSQAVHLTYSTTCGAAIGRLCEKCALSHWPRVFVCFACERCFIDIQASHSNAESVLGVLSPDHAERMKSWLAACAGVACRHRTFVRPANMPCSVTMQVMGDVPSVTHTCGQPRSCVCATSATMAPMKAAASSAADKASRMHTTAKSAHCKRRMCALQLHFLALCNKQSHVAPVALLAHARPALVGAPYASARGGNEWCQCHWHRVRIALEYLDAACQHLLRGHACSAHEVLL